MTFKKQKHAWMLYATKCGNLVKRHNFLGKHESPKLTQEEVENINSPIISEKVVSSYF